MKKKNLILFFVMCMFTFTINIKAESSITCSPTNAYVGDQITCSIKTDEPVEITSKLSLVAGDTTMDKDGNIVYKALNKGIYDVTLKTIEPGFSTSVKVNVTEKTTTTKTTTSTTKAKSDNNYLSSITIDGEKIEDFNKTNTKYFIEVENDVTKVSLKATPEDDNAIVELDGPKTLEVGDNEYTISVTSENDTTKFYKVIITRKEEEESSDNDIKSIKIKGYHLNFDKSSKTFYLNIDKEDTELDITVNLKDENASYEIEGNENLKDGSIIKIIVTAEDGNSDTYRIIIEKNDSNYVPLIIIGIIVLIIIGLIVFCVIRKNKKKVVKKTNEPNKKEAKTDNKIISEEDENNYNEEKTIEMPVIGSESKEKGNLFSNSNEEDDEIDIPLIDNDEEEETRILSYAEREELEKTRINDNIESIIDNELEKNLSRKDNNED